ncbi:MAG: rRNA maturation RNase YbeY [Bacteroidales bacterium]
MAEINFFSEDIAFSPENTNTLKSWIKKVALAESCSIDTLNYIFCSDAYLLKINIQYLNHSFYTDIISFPYNETDDPITGDCFISIERVKENAKLYTSGFSGELARVLIHGFLHLAGYDDKTREQKAIMQEKENKYVDLYKCST